MANRQYPVPNQSSPGSSGVSWLLNFPNARFIPLTNLVGSSTGGTVTPIYTCPAGRRGLVMSVAFLNNVGGTSSTFAISVTAGATTFQISASGSASAGTIQLSSTQNYILEAGEVLGASNATTTTYTCYGSVLEFDNTGPARSAKLTTLATGLNTVYTCPASKTALLFPAAFAWAAASGGGLVYRNDTGSTQTIKWYLVPNAGSATTATQLLGGSGGTVVSTASSSIGGVAPISLTTGDTIQINLSGAGTAPQWAFATVLEM
jgi:hypothetical protein